MKAPLFKKAVLAACLMITTWISAGAVELNEKPPQPGFYPVAVNGRVLSGPNSLARSNAGRIVVPISSIAVYLGDTVEADPNSRVVTVRRLGVVAVFDASSGQVHENGAPILTISSSREITFTSHVTEMMLPMEIAAPLFDASMRLDTVKNTVMVSRGIGSTGVVSRDIDQGWVELYQADYEYGLSRYTGSIANNFAITATGRLFDGRFFINSNSSGSIGKFMPRNFSFNLERPNGQRFIVGDFGTGSALPLLTANVRGGLATMPLGKFTVAAFGGRADSGTVLPILFRDEPDLLLQRPKPRFDSSIFGGYVSRSFGSTVTPIMLSAGAMRFTGPSRNGTVTSSTVVYNGSRLRMQADAGVGSFEGRDADSRSVGGIGTAFDISGTYQIADNLSFHGRVTQIGPDFLSPQSGVRDPVNLKAVGVSWSPAKWLSTTFNASTTRRPGRSEAADSYVAAAFGFSPGAGKPRFYFSHSQNRSAQVRSGAFTTFNASHDLRRLRLFVTASRIKMNGPVTASAVAGANVALNDKHSLEISQGIGTGNRLSGAIDWRTSGLLGGRMSLSAGGGYNHVSGGNISVFERLTASLNLPKRSSLQVSYMHTATAGPTVLVQLRGSIFRKREAGAFVNSPVAETNKLSTISGRVYQDVDGDGRYLAGTDKPQAGVKVRIDGNRYAESDANGVYQFDAVVAGNHKLYLDLLSVRADLTLLDGAARELSLDSGQATTFDFRLVRTGRVSGRVWIDTNANGSFDQGEQPLPDIRVVASSGRDTLTDHEGFFTISDLAPGEQVFLIDEKTIPEKLIPAIPSLAAQVLPGRETRDVSIPVIPVPAELKRFPSRTQP